jgi:hypothetical protein
MIEFKKYEGSEALEDLGTLASQIGNKGTVKFAKTNFNGTKRVVVIATNDAGDSAVVTCSANLSAHLRKAKTEGATKEELLAHVVDLNILENEEGIAYITMPGGEQTEGITIGALKKVRKSEKVEKLLTVDEIPW